MGYCLCMRSVFGQGVLISSMPQQPPPLQKKESQLLQHLIECMKAYDANSDEWETQITIPTSYARIEFESDSKTEFSSYRWRNTSEPWKSERSSYQTEEQRCHSVSVKGISWLKLLLSLKQMHSMASILQVLHGQLLQKISSKNMP